MALAGLDMAAWDALARQSNLSLCETAWWRSGYAYPGYASLRGWDTHELTVEAANAALQGFRAIKLKFGHPSLAAEKAVYDAVRSTIGNDMEIFVDPNHAFSVPSLGARQTLCRLGNLWLEEPIRADDLMVHQTIRRAVPHLAIQRGENDWGQAISPDRSRTMLVSFDAGRDEDWRSDGVDPCDSTSGRSRNSGQQPYLRGGQRHLLAATANRHWLEWLDIAAPVIAEGRPSLENGIVKAHTGPGIGLRWAEDAVRRFHA